MEWIGAFLQNYGMAAIFLLILMEYACFPVSSEIILPLAGLLAAGQGLSFPILLLISSLAGLGGSTITYLIGRFGGSLLLERAMKRFPSTKKPILSSYRAFGNHGNTAVFLSRLIPLCRTYIGFVSGAMKQSFVSYVLFSAFGILLWNTVLTGLGYYFYPYREQFFRYFDEYKHVILFGGAGLLVLILLCRIRKKPRRDDTDREE
jgi:membrane protein DedA with SNARE-associated domain